MRIERRILPLILVVTLAIPWVQAIAAIIREAAGLADPSIAFALTLATDAEHRRFSAEHP